MKCRCRSTSRCCTATTTSWWSTSRTSWRRCRGVGTSRRRRSVRLRRELDLPELSPAHRLDRLTAGVLLFTARREVRGAYQTLFARGEVRKTYLARAAVDPAFEFPTDSAQPNHQASAGSYRPFEEPGEPNAETLVELSRRRPVPADAAHRPHASAAGAHGVAGPADHRRPVVSERDRRGARRLLTRRCGCWLTASSSTIRSADVCAGLSVGAVSTNDGASVDRLWQYPVKSMQGSEVDAILLGPSGVAGDRAYGFVDVETGPVGQRERLQAVRRPAGLPCEIPHPAHQRRPATPDRGHLS